MPSPSALPDHELLDPLPAQPRHRQSAPLQPPTQPPDLPQLVDRRQRRIAARARNSAEYASANSASGPTINTLHTLLDAPAIAASFSENKKDNDRQNHRRYADIYTAINPIRNAPRQDIGITRTSAYSWILGRRAAEDGASPARWRNSRNVEWTLQ